MHAAARFMQASISVYNASTLKRKGDMPADEKLTREYHELVGALDVLATLREEFEQWVEEAQDDSKEEALENVLGHVEAMETQYRKRRDDAQRRLETKG